MLFGYPLKAVTDNNWFHEALVECLSAIHRCARSGLALPAWPDSLPERARSDLRLKWGLRDRVQEYYDAAVSLSATEHDEVVSAVAQQNLIPDLLAGTVSCKSLADLPVKIQAPARRLFEFSFGLLTDLNVRDDYYRVVLGGIPSRVCPFCGLEAFVGVGAPREDLDHYLAESRYPYSAANLRNLVPMGGKCNSGHKLQQDMMFAEDGRRRKCFDPYSAVQVSVSLDASVPFAGANGLPEWDIRFEPQSEEVVTWCTVFDVPNRYRRDVLNLDFEDWLAHFGSWCAGHGVDADDDAQLIRALERYERYQRFGKYADRAFLKAAAFRMLRIHCLTADSRLLELLRNIVRNAP